MKPTISVFLFTHAGDKYHLINCFRSLVVLKPDELCVLDTTKDIKLSDSYLNYIRELASKFNLPLKTSYRKWKGSFKEMANASLKMCSMEWGVQMYSDDMMTKELAKDLRALIIKSPPETLVLRAQKLNLIDDNYCIDNLWRGSLQRLPPGSHGQIIKLGYGKYEGSEIDMTYTYSGRTEIPWESPLHPKKDLHGYYIAHLWLYKDNVMRRSWAAGDIEFEERMKKLRKSKCPEGMLWKMARNIFLKKRKYKLAKIPKDKISLVPIEWEVGENWYEKDYWNKQVSENIEREVV